MAKFNVELPTEIIKDFEKIHHNADEIFGKMTRAGAEVVLAKCNSTAPQAVRPYASLSRTYRTPSDGGINTQVHYLGYIPFSNPNRKYFTRRGGGYKYYSSTEGVPVEFLCNMYEYGRSTSYFPKSPWFRKAFRQDEIERAMMDEQKRASGGLLDE